MTSAQTGSTRVPKPLRLWPGVVLVTLQWVLRFVVPVVFPAAGMVAVLGSLVAALGVFAWWLFFSRAPWRERLAVAAIVAVVAVATTPLLHASIAGGMMGMMFTIYVIPGLCLALVGWAVLSRGLVGAPRYAALAAAVMVACGVWTLVRTEGLDGEGDSDFEWRWTPTAEERLLAAREAELPPSAPAARPAAPEAAAAAPTAPPPEAAAGAVEAPPSGQAATAAPAADAPGAPEPPTAVPTSGSGDADWPGFRGPRRDGVTPAGVRIATDWTATPPVELWRRPVGPGWSSFAVSGDRVYTQEQRGEEEVVACYRLSTGEPVWSHHDAVRFWESNAGAGPRATPTLAGDRVYTFGATGILNALDAEDGTLLWSRNPATDTGRDVPMWGFSSSPLVLGDVVVVAAAGIPAAYDAATGATRWLGTEGGGGYSSPHPFTLDGETQVVLMGAPGATGFSPADGKQLWQHAMPSGTRIVQPAVTAEGDLLLAEGDGHGMRRVSVTRAANGWTVQERWTTIGLKPYFNDFVVHEGHAYGFDGNMLAAIDLATGKRKWKGGRYGHGQLVLLPGQDLLLVLSEEGELALVDAAPAAFVERTRVPAIDGKTWNHPVLVGDVLLVRNGLEMAAYRLPLAGPPGTVTTEAEAASARPAPGQ